MQLTSQERDEAKKYCMSAVKYLMKKYDENNWEDYSKTNGLNSHHEEYHKDQHEGPDRQDRGKEKHRPCLYTF